VSFKEGNEIQPSTLTSRPVMERNRKNVEWFRGW